MTILTAAIKTLKSKEIETKLFVSRNYIKNILQGAGIGLVTGFVGAGGGFLIVPALIFTTGIQLTNAIATSLFVISITTTLGFLGDFNSSVEINWKLLFFAQFALP
ncbi:sulfite exporter TauE/SafE family protein [Xanthomarina sp.]|uniref:sulfite exporter TauE/SafE family protein n=1 Tax=Xanthomarina sp. TaxID=1931211 RepID=UPI002C7B229D|nr:sulfite exporter TauE/SafE family protein [Xanthomarina sp.]HLV38708.1 sulfite exporter TauE/SafE family protein [Xanthomarina sp.]